MVYYEFCLIKSRFKERYKVHCEQRPYGSFLKLPKWLQLETSQVYTNIRSAKYNLYNIQTKMQELGLKSVIYFELLLGDF